MTSVWQMIKASLAQHRNPSPEVQAERERWEAFARSEAMTQRAAEIGHGDVDGVRGMVQRSLGSIDMSTLVPPRSDLVKRVSCAACGTAKQLPSVRVHVYCDFCGQLIDYDLRQAMREAYRTPSVVEYAKINNQLNPRATAAARVGDVDTYRESKAMLLEAQTALIPWVVPPRAWSDDAYRQEWVRYETELAVVCAFDPGYAALSDQVVQCTQALGWAGGNVLGMAVGALTGRAPGEGSRPLVEAETFWPLVDVLVAQAQRMRQLRDAGEVWSLDPDQLSGAVADRLHRSGIVQGWLPSLAEADRDQLIERLGIDFLYDRPTVRGVPRTCGGCGHELEVLDGATTVVCDACGRRVDASGPGITCGGCDTVVALPEGVDEVACSACGGRVRRV